MVYFSLACTAGVLISSSCILGDYLSRKLAPSTAPHISRSRHNHDYSQIQFHNNPKLGSWTRPSTLNMDCKGTMPSPWTVSVPGKKAQEQHSSSSYPWVFFDPKTEEKKAVIHCQGDNLNNV